ncbi:hypothetical protein [Oceanobacillus sojae]|uniref:hypothetical protein n=1 Tax=Oceanobacillus sojae TaxID=582851 RepID=UPI0021A65862|nr:hypothetical protein [Oceanobacillus sojae]MCT1905265.1 hypothetical protein [Oceanobacillus sojae]
MKWEQSFIESVAKGEKVEEVQKLSQMQAMSLGLAVRDYEEQQGINLDTVQLDNDAIGKFIQDHNKNVKNY